jgi:hypothetical protein
MEYPALCSAISLQARSKKSWRADLTVKSRQGGFVTPFNSSYLQVEEDEVEILSLVRLELAELRPPEGNEIDFKSSKVLKTRVG